MCGVRIVDLPREFSRRGDVSVMSLLPETGYFEVHQEVSERLISEALRLDRERLRDWFTFSESKRANFGWYIEKGSLGDYVVGRLAEDASANRRLRYQNDVEAFAAFIKRELESMRILNDGERMGEDF